MFAAFGQLVLGWLFADLLTGIFHWWEDRVPTEQMPFLGEWLIAPNRLHHRKPLVFLKGNVLDRSLSTAVAALVVGAVWFLLWGPSLFWFATILGGMVSTEVHRYTHEPKAAPRVVRVLQEIGFVQSPKHHARHHRPPSDRCYCSLTNWLNPVLDDLDIWNSLERLLLRLHLPISQGRL